MLLIIIARFQIFNIMKLKSIKKMFKYMHKYFIPNVNLDGVNFFYSTKIERNSAFR